jgi:hypothetical protein
VIFFVIAIEVKCASFALSEELRGDARRFLPHISILPRFSLDHVNAQVLVQRAPFTRLPNKIALRGPRLMSDQLAWYECRPQDIGFKELIALHGSLASELSPPARPNNTNHWGQEYRPHMTIRSNEVATQCVKLPSLLQVQPLGAVIYEYNSEGTDPAKRYLLESTRA